MPQMGVLDAEYIEVLVWGEETIAKECYAFVFVAKRRGVLPGCSFFSVFLNRALRVPSVVVGGLLTSWVLTASREPKQDEGEELLILLRASRLPLC